MEALLRIDMHAEWLVSGERDRSSGADAAQVRDRDGYPYIPGRSVKGLLREGGEMLVTCLGDRARLDLLRLFGSEADAGCIAVGDALLPRDTCDMLVEVAPVDSAHPSDQLTTVLARTAIDPQTGSAKDHSLRFLEATIPGLALFSRLSVPEKADLDFLAAAAGLVKHLGSGRHRGLGRCALSVLEAGKPIDCTAYINHRGEKVS